MMKLFNVIYTDQNNTDAKLHRRRSLVGECFLLRRDESLDFHEIFCIFANMSCLCIHLVTLFNLPCKNIFVME